MEKNCCTQNKILAQQILQRQEQSEKEVNNSNRRPQFSPIHILSLWIVEGGKKATLVYFTTANQVPWDWTA